MRTRPLIEVGSGHPPGPCERTAASPPCKGWRSQTDVHIPVGAMTAFAVTGTRNDGTRVDVTQEAQAVSSDTYVATVTHGPGSQIQIGGASAGTATITVMLGMLRQTCAVTVTR